MNTTRRRGGPFAEAMECQSSRGVLVSADDGGRVDATHAVVAAIAYSIWERRGGSSVDNWLEAERLVQALVAARPVRVRRRVVREW